MRKAAGPKRCMSRKPACPLATVESMIQEGDAAMRRSPGVKDANLFYLYPHHMVSNPMMYGAFNRLSMNDIVGYRYRVDSVCLGLANGRLTRDVRKTTEYDIDVRR